MTTRVRLALMVVGSMLAAADFSAAQTGGDEGTRWAGLTAGPYGVGFESRQGVDLTRTVNQSQAGMPIGLALWYPAAAMTPAAGVMTQLDYRLLQFVHPLDDVARTAFETGEADTIVGWRHVGIVEVTADQARASLRSGGRAIRGATRVDGPFPVVLVLGGPYYLATTAELLASHGFLVAAAFRFQDVPNEVGTEQSSWYLENSVRDAEWALAELQRDTRADLRSVSVLGHGGGGAQALLVAMRNRLVTAAVNLDSGNFSTRTALRTIPFYSPRLMRSPYLFIATSATRDSQDQYEDFLAMKFSTRFEVILGNPDLRHHDFSDVGRAITAPLGIRGAPQPAVRRQHAEVHDMIVRFLRAYSGRETTEGDRFAGWLNERAVTGRYAVSVRPGVEPAPTLPDLLNRLGRNTTADLRAAHQRDPDAPIFQADSLEKLIARALLSNATGTAVELADFATGIHPRSLSFPAQKSQALEQSGDAEGALAIANACAAMPTGNDWRATMLADQCRDRAARLALRRTSPQPR